MTYPIPQPTAILLPDQQRISGISQSRRSNLIKCTMGTVSGILGCGLCLSGAYLATSSMSCEPCTKKNTVVTLAGVAVCAVSASCAVLGRHLFESMQTERQPAESYFLRC